MYTSVRPYIAWQLEVLHKHRFHNRTNSPLVACRSASLAPVPRQEAKNRQRHLLEVKETDGLVTFVGMVVACLRLH